MAAYGGQAGWHYEYDVQQAVRQYHDNYCQQPLEEMRKAKQHLETVLDQICGTLRDKRICSRREYQGSSYDGTKIDDGLEFDVMVIMKCKGLSVERVRNGEFNVKVNRPFVKNPVVHSAATGRNMTGYTLDPKKTSAKFFGELQKSKNENRLRKTVIVKKHGTAVQLDIRRGSLFYSVDMVPTFEINMGLYIPTENIWLGRQASELRDKRRLRTIDWNNTCKRESLRVLKKLKSKGFLPWIKKSYTLKQILLQEEGNGDWSRDQIGSCVIRLLIRLSNDNTQLGAKRAAKRERAVQKLKQILNDEHEFMRVFES